jgi:glycogen debranching enzyme
MPSPLDQTAEWLEADGLGGFASGTAPLIRTRRYHGVLLCATTPPTGRFMLVNGVEAWVETPAGVRALTSHKYAPGVLHPPGALSLTAFAVDPWPRWTWRLDDGTEMEGALFVPGGARGMAMCVMTWRLVRGSPLTRLHARPLISGRDYHALHHENGAFRFDAEVRGEWVQWTPYAGVPGILARSNGVYTHGPDWYRSFLYDEERARGLDHEEDLASPGTIRFDLGAGEAVLLLAATGIGAAGGGAEDLLKGPASAASLAGQLAERERHRRAAFPTALERAGDAYLVRRGVGTRRAGGPVGASARGEGNGGGWTIIAGYPWFTDWGRDTFIALRGLCLATGRLDEAGAILREWAGAVSEGMLPNRFPDRGGEPEYNSVDASLWYCVAAGEYLEAMSRGGRAVPASEERALRGAVLAIVEGYARGTRYGIRQDDDGLLAAGEVGGDGVQLTWMDARCGDWVVTPRIGKPVEVQGLWANALAVAGRFEARWGKAAERVARVFGERFWNEARSCLFDVVDVDHVRGRTDGTLRPNQVFAVGGLPRAMLDPRGERARRVVEAVERRLLTPMGLRSLAPEEPGYRGRYEGGPLERDGAYHQGTVWPWLMGAFVEAWVRVRGETMEARREAHRRFVEPLVSRSERGGEGGVGGVGHIAEIADGDPPHAARGCPFQAWSVGEVLRLERVVLEGAVREDDRRGVGTAAAGADGGGERRAGRAPAVRTG